MITRLLQAEPGLRIMAALALPAVAGLRAWLSYRTTVVKERSRNRRLDAAIGGTAPAQRPEILRAIGELEHAASCPEPEDRPHDHPHASAVDDVPAPAVPSVGRSISR
jgi:hypothetical protein